MTEKELKSFLRQPYSRADWKPLLRQLFKHVDLFSTPQQLFDENQLVLHGEQFGIVQLEDGKSIALFEVEVADKILISKNRVALRDIAAKYIDQNIIHGAWVFYYSKNQPDYRLSFIARQSELNEEGQLIRTETHRKRFTYVLGANEPCTTAALRLLDLEAKNAAGFINIRTVVDAFSVERLSREFFKQYKETHYDRFTRHLNGEDYNGKTVSEPHEYLQSVFFGDRRAAREFVKKLLGRTIFMFFLQKKGWLGCPAKAKDWKNGDPRFIQNLFENCPEPLQFHSRYLSELFYEALNKDRRKQNDFFELTGNRVPFLNGGLFERDSRHDTSNMDFPPNFFGDLLAFFEQYNFTIDENSPDEQEIGIDPEMLGHIFENLLEDNKGKGAFYTPKEIVHYMCQESLVQYLQTHTQPELALDIEALIRLKIVPLNLTERVNARHLTTLLEEVKICDPAIGSGAFPIGLLQEIYRALLFLYPYTDPKTEFDPAAVKKDIIQNAIYGVDKDGGAVDIARLRFWLALVVDEDVPQPLPNLDYKIMQGDSLLERFEGIRLDNLLQTQQVLYLLENGQMDMFGKIVDPQIRMGFSDETKNDLEELLKDYFLPKQEDKASIKSKIERIVHDHIEYNIELQEISITRQKNETNSLLVKIRIDKGDSIANRQKKEKRITQLQKSLEQLERELLRLENAHNRLLELQEKELERPFFLWHLFFKEVFDDGGFDIVVGNPPYFQIQKLPNEYKIELESVEYKTYEKGSDLYCLFYERAFQVLRPGGVLAYITSNSWMKTKYGERLRGYFIKEAMPIALLNFEDSQIFQSAIVETNILIAKKGHVIVPLRAAVIGPDVHHTMPLHEILTAKGMKIPDLSEKEWIIGDAESMALKLKIEIGGKLLGEWDVTIFRGVLTGFNEAFIIPEETKKILINEDPANEELLRPVLRGRDLKKYNFEFAKMWLINAHNGVKPRSIGGQLAKKEIARVDIPKNYPAIFRHLQQFQPQLEIRQDKGDHWTNLRNCAYLEDFERPKIIWGELSDAPKFAYDEFNYYLDVTLFFMTGKHLKYILAILNSRVGEWYFNQISTTSGMGTNRWKKYKIEQLPIPDVKNIKPDDVKIVERLVEYLLYLNDSASIDVSQYASNSQVAATFEDAMNQIVYELYFGDYLKDKKLDVLQFFTLKTLPVLEGDSNEKAETIRHVFNWLLESDNSVRTRIQASNILSPEILQVINSSSK